MKKAKKALLILLVLLVLPVSAPATFTFDSETKASPSPAPQGVDALMDIGIDPYAFRGIPWSMTMEEVAESEGGRAYTKTVRVKNVVLYDLDVAELAYHFEDGQMTSRTFTFKRSGQKIFSAVFYSICLRYGLPITAERRTAAWQAGPLNVRLSRGDEMTCAFTLDISTTTEGNQ